MKKKEDILLYDFQGWPVYRQTLRELFESLKMIDKNGDIIIRHDDPLLDTYPTTLIEDGMGYGVDEMYFTHAERVDTGIRLWRDFKSEIKDNK